MTEQKSTNEQTVTLWVRVSGTITVPKHLAEKMKEQNSDWLEEFNNYEFKRDHSDDYVPACECNSPYVS